MKAGLTREELDQIVCPVCGRTGFLRQKGDWKGAPIWCHQARVAGTKLYPEPTLITPLHRVVHAEGGGYMGEELINCGDEAEWEEEDAWPSFDY